MLLHNRQLRRNRALSLLILAATALILVSFSGVLADESQCECNDDRGSTLEEQFDNVDVVFRVRVRKEVPFKGDDPNDENIFRSYRATVLRQFGGYCNSIPSKRNVILTSTRDQACSLTFEIGESYVVLGRVFRSTRGRNNYFFTECDFVTPWPEVTIDERKFLRSKFDPMPLPGCD